MSKTRKKGFGIMLLVAAVMLFSSCAGGGQADRTGEVLQEGHIGQKEQTDQNGNQAAYQTDTIKRGTFIRNSNFDGVVYYPELSQVAYEGETAILSEWLVEQGSEVKKGDPVANIQIEYDEVRLEEMEVQLERLEDDYEWQQEVLESELKTKQERARGASERSREMLEYRQAEKELERYQLSMEQQINKQKEQIQEFQERIAVTELTAPMDGVVSELSFLKSGEYLPQGESLMVIYNPDLVWLRVTDNGAQLRYNMDVEIETGPPKNRTVLSGKVIAADNILPDALRRGVAFIELDELPEKVNWSNTSVRVALVQMEQVLLVNRLAVESDTGGSFVYLLEDGSLHKRQVIRSEQGTDASWILMGVEEGQEVIISQ